MEKLLEEYKGKIPQVILNEVRKQGKIWGLTKPKTKQVLEILKKKYDDAKIDPGEGIGIVTAESFGEPGTQMTLNVFHFAGVAEVSVSLGLPRIIELFDARKTIKTPMMTIFLENQYKDDANKVKKIAFKIKEITLREYASDFYINIPKLQVDVILNKKKMREVGVNPTFIGEKLQAALKSSQIKVKEDRIIIKTKTEENELMDLYKLKEKAKETFISGIKGVVQVLPVKSGNEFIILTAGSNLKDVLEMKEVDETKTISNDVFEIYKVLGIEAARLALINEARRIYDDQGLSIDIRHLMFISDLITMTGQVKGITRSGITGEKESVLARASFETPTKHIINASLAGEEDTLNSVIENVMLNQPVPLGTGLPDLVTKMGAKE